MAGPHIPLSAHERVYTADQFSNTVSVIDPATITLLGVTRLGEPSEKGKAPTSVSLFDQGLIQRWKHR
ncbi:MAG TPA: hypothetical protein VMA86_11035 [Acetobacteraceae bacterium]|nr:hypothetical protein [Acetobacteraceae bacterium]